MPDSRRMRQPPPPHTHDLLRRRHRRPRRLEPRQAAPQRTAPQVSSTPSPPAGPTNRRNALMNDHPLAAWPALRVGERALIPERDTAREPPVTAVTLLDPHEGEGDGFVAHRGRVIRHHFYDAR